MIEGPLFWCQFRSADQFAELYESLPLFKAAGFKGGVWAEPNEGLWAAADVLMPQMKRRFEDAGLVFIPGPHVAGIANKIYWRSERAEQKHERHPMCLSDPRWWAELEQRCYQCINWCGGDVPALFLYFEYLWWKFAIDRHWWMKQLSWPSAPHRFADLLNRLPVDSLLYHPQIGTNVPANEVYSKPVVRNPVLDDTPVQFLSTVHNYPNPPWAQRWVPTWDHVTTLMPNHLRCYAGAQAKYNRQVIGWTDPAACVADCIDTSKLILWCGEFPKLNAELWEKSGVRM